MENFNFPRTRVYKSFSVCKILTREEVEVRYYDVARMLPWIAKHFDSNELASSRKFDSNFNHRAFIYENNVAGENDFIGYEFLRVESLPRMSSARIIEGGGARATILSSFESP